jgi:hypothetical protein
MINKQARERERERERTANKILGHTRKAEKRKRFWIFGDSFLIV